MSDVALTAAQVAPVNETEYEAWTLKTAEAITVGQAVAVNTAGKWALADASSAAQNNVRGIALRTVGAGEALTALVHGSVAGFTLTALAYDDAVYLSNTAGAVATSAGDVSVVVGRVKPMSDADITKVLYVNIPAIM
jgi:hypothetical protein